MGSIVDTLFGGMDYSTQGNQQAANVAAMRDLRNLQAQADAARRGGYSAAAQLLGGLVPRQMGILSDASVEAQRALRAGLPMQQAAILGQPLTSDPFGSLVNLDVMNQPGGPGGNQSFLDYARYLGGL